ncbi:MAG: ComEC/Rec2 family competence protein [Opitutales bacterium]
MKPFSDTEPLAPSAPETPARPLRAPLVWILFPLVLGIIAAAATDLVAPFFLALLGLIFLALSLRLEAPGRWGAALLLGATALAWAWAEVRLTRAPPEWDQLPPREVFVLAQVESVSRGQTYPDYSYARLTLADVPALLAELEGQRAFATVRQRPEDPPLEEGGLYRLRGVLHSLTAAEARESDFVRSQRAQQVFFRLRQGRVLEEVEGPGALGRTLEATQQRWATWLTDAPPAHRTEARLLGAMMLGERSFLSEEQETAFLLSGTMHLFAISGLHVVIVALTLRRILQFLPLPPLAREVLVLSLLLVYVAVTGFAPSALRAFSMVAFHSAATQLGRASSAVPAVLASAVLVLVWQPGQLFSLGFQLSYSVVGGILLFGLPLAETLRLRWRLFRLRPRDDLRAWHHALRWLQERLLDSTCISLAATLASAPLIILHFQVWTPGAILLNAVLIPLATLVFAAGVLVILLHCLGLGLAGHFFAYGAWLVLIAMDRFVDAFSRIPGVFSIRQWHAPALAYLVGGGFLLGLWLLGEYAPRLPRRRLGEWLGGTAALLLALLWLGTGALP